MKLYDTTLRDGMQGQGMSLSAGEKVRVVHKLDELGVHLIEAGFPSSNPKEVELFKLLEGESLEQATICAFGMTRRRDTDAASDPALAVLVECFAPVCTLVGKTWPYQARNGHAKGEYQHSHLLGHAATTITGRSIGIQPDPYLNRVSASPPCQSKLSF